MRARRRVRRRRSPSAWRAACSASRSTTSAPDRGFYDGVRRRDGLRRRSRAAAARRRRAGRAGRDPPRRARALSARRRTPRSPRGGERAAADLTDDEIVAQLRVIMFGAIETIQSRDHEHDPAAAPRSRVARGWCAPTAPCCRTRSRSRCGSSRRSRSSSAGRPPTGRARRRRARRAASSSASRCSPRTATRPCSRIRCGYDVRRENARRHLSFSFGEHFCLGAHLARLELATALGRILDRFPNLRLVTCEEPGGFAFRRPATLELEWR